MLPLALTADGGPRNAGLEHDGLVKRTEYKDFRNLALILRGGHFKGDAVPRERKGGIELAARSIYYGGGG